MKERLFVKGYHVLFAVSIAALVALGAWWTVFIGHAIEVERRSALKELEHASEILALELGHASRPPLPGAILGTRLEVVPTPELIPGEIHAGLKPSYREFSVRPLKDAVDGISARTLRRKVMVAGEGSLLFVLLGICTVMLYVLARAEKKQARAMDQFISTVTHEMKTPLTGLKSLVQTFSSGMVPRGREQELLTMGLKEIERLDHMIENVLISGRLRTEWYRLEDETVQLRGILDSFIAHRRLYMSGGQGTIELKWEPEEPDLSVRCDRKAVLVILENLTDNAQKYSTDTPEVTVAVRWDGRGVMVAVEDKGIGFEPGLAEKLFMPFVRAAGPGVDSRHGTGLGLAISRSLARRMGGDLKAESGGPGKGSCFTLILKGTRA